MDYKKHDLEERNTKINKIASELLEVIEGNKVTLYEFSLIMKALDRKVSQSTYVARKLT